MSIIDDIINEDGINDIKEQVEFMGNFTHSDRHVCHDLISEASYILKEYGWENDFALYYHQDGFKIRLYLRMAYVASCFLDGTWEDIKERIPYIISLLRPTIELRKERNLGMLWIERQVTKLDWIKSGV